MKASQPQSTEPSNKDRADGREATSPTAADEHPTPKLTYSVPEVAKMPGISRASTYTYVRSGEIPSITRKSNRPDHAGVIYLAATTGARRGEICAIRQSHFNTEHQTLTIARSIVKKDDTKIDRPTKNRRIRPIAIDAKAASSLQERLDTAIANSRKAGTTLVHDPYIFADDPRGAEPWDPDTALSRFLADSEDLTSTQLQRFP